MKIETIMEQWEEYIMDRTLLLVSSVENEDYEFSQIMKDEIDKKVSDLAKLLQDNKLTTLDHHSVVEQLNKRTHLHMREWYDILEVPDEKRASF